MNKGALLITCLTSASRIEQGLPSEFISRLTEEFGRLHLRLFPRVNWQAPENYRLETGRDLVPIVFSFDQFLTVQDLSNVKKKTIEFEDHFTIWGNRHFNLNPGILSSDGLMLASHKEGPYRFGLDARTWIEPQLSWNEAGLRSYPWTFSEFLDPWYLSRLSFEFKKILSAKIIGRSGWASNSSGAIETNSRFDGSEMGWPPAMGVR